MNEQKPSDEIDYSYKDTAKTDYYLIANGLEEEYC
jgi:hypothetical protein